MWHASVSVQDRTGALHQPRIAERHAIEALADVGGDHEWWIWRTEPRVGHLRVPITAAEAALVPPGCVLGDAGESGPLRPRTRL